MASTFQMNNRYHGIVVVKVRDGKICNWREYQYKSNLEWKDFVGNNEFGLFPRRSTLACSRPPDGVPLRATRRSQTQSATQLTTRSFEADHIAL